MIQEVKMYTVICDNCKKSADDDTSYSGWNDKDYAQDVATEADWIKENDNDYCPDCYSYDDEDNLIISTMTTANISVLDCLLTIKKLAQQEECFIDEVPEFLQKDLRNFLIGHTLSTKDNRTVTYDMKAYHKKIMYNGFDYPIKWTKK